MVFEILVETTYSAVYVQYKCYLQVSYVFISFPTPWGISSAAITVEVLTYLSH